MITKRVSSRKDRRTSAAAALQYGEGLTPDPETGQFKEKSHRTRFGNFGLVDDGVYFGRNKADMSELIEMAAIEMQANCNLNTRVGAGKRIAHFIFSFNQNKPSDAALRDTEDSMLAALKLNQNHFVTFLHDDNGYWHIHVFVSLIDKIKHLGNPLWRDKTIRDRVCREVEIRHGLERDNGLHQINDAGQIVEVPREERRNNREQNAGVTDRARTTEIYSGAKTYQTWANDIRLGDRLKHAKSWHELHAAAAEYGSEVKPKGTGFVVCPIGENGGIQLSKLGLKNLSSRFGAFQQAKPTSQRQPETAYAPSPTNTKAASHYQKWRQAKDAFKPVSIDRVNVQRELHKKVRQDLRAQQKSQLENIRAATKGAKRFAAVSLSKMHHTVALEVLSDAFLRERQALRSEIAAQGPGNTFRDYLVREARKGDNVALGLARKYGVDEATMVSREREADQLQIRAAVSGHEFLAAPRLRFTHHIERSGTVVYDMGNGRVVTDSATAKQIQLNNAAANDPEAIATALRFATAKFGNALTLSGSPEFLRLAVETAVRQRLGVRFADPALEAYRQKLVADRQRSPISIGKEKKYACNNRIEHLRQIAPAHLRNRLHNLSAGDLVLDTSRDVGTLRSNVPKRLEQPEEGGNYPVQRSAGRSEGVGRTDAVSISSNPKPASNIPNGAIAEHSKPESSRGERVDVPVAASTEPLQAPQTQAEGAGEQSVLEWAREWGKANHKEIVEPRPGNGDIHFTVIHMTADGIVLDTGRSLAVYPKPTSLGVNVGDKVGVGKDRQILLLQKSKGNELER